MKQNPFLASILSLFVPGLGQIYVGKSERGAAILIAVIIVGNLNAIWLSAYSLSGMVPASFFNSTLPRILHDVFAFYGIIFWIWQVADAYLLTRVQV
jgi:TM2 domain-containing membrane protein YozV